MVTTPINSKVLALFLIKETKKQYVHLVLLPNDKINILFSNKHGFNTNFTCDIDDIYTIYNLHYEKKNSWLVSKNTKKIVSLELKLNVRMYLNILCDLIHKLELKKIDNLWNILMFINSNKNEKQNEFIICKLILIILHKEKLVMQSEYSCLCLEILKYSYDIIISNNIQLNWNKILWSFYTICENYGIELYTLRKIKI